MKQKKGERSFKLSLDKQVREVGAALMGTQVSDGKLISFCQVAFVSLCFAGGEALRASGGSVKSAQVLRGEANS